MSNSNLNLILDKDYIFIFDLSKNVLNNFSNDPVQNLLCNQWLSKLNSVHYKGMTAKRTRNSYLTKLIVCMFDKKLSEMFLKTPPDGELDPIPMPSIIETEPYWLKDAIGLDEAGGAKDCRTYISSELLDNNRGFCAYLGMNIIDEGDEDYNWLNMGDGSKFDKEFKDIYEVDEKQNFENWIRNEEMKKVTPENAYFEHRKFLIKLILEELEGKSEQANSELEEPLLTFLKNISGSVDEQTYQNLPLEKKRQFLLITMKSVLLNECIQFNK